MGRTTLMLQLTHKLTSQGIPSDIVRQIILPEDCDARYEFKHSLSFPLLLNSAPGTGKTEAAVRRIAHHAQRKFLLTVFNCAVQKEISVRTASLSNVQVATFDSLCFVLRKHAPQAEPMELSDALTTLRCSDTLRSAVCACIDHGFVHLDSSPLSSATSVPVGALRELLTEVCEGEVWSFDLIRLAACMFGFAHVLRQSFDEIIVDEAQDLNPLFYNILRQSGCALTFMGDSNQRLYSFHNLVSIFDENEQKFTAVDPTNQFAALPPLQCRKVLQFTQSFRLSNKIVEFVKRNRPELHALRGSGTHGLVQMVDLHHRIAQPYLYLFRTWGECCRAIVNQVPWNIYAFAYLHKTSAEFLDIARLKCPPCLFKRVQQCTWKHYQANAAIRFSTVHAAKGCEVKHARLSRWLMKQTWSSFCPHKYSESESAVQYVAQTRASDTLSIDKQFY
jgi:superfamily I DNA/RNA helicase